MTFKKSLSKYLIKDNVQICTIFNVFNFRCHYCFLIFYILKLVDSFVIEYICICLWESYEITNLWLFHWTENNNNSSVITGHGRIGRQFHAYHRACPKFPTVVETNPITRNSSGDRSGNTGGSSSSTDAHYSFLLLLNATRIFLVDR